LGLGNYAAFDTKGVRASRGRIARLMASFGIVGRRGRRRVRTTIPAKKPAPFADLVQPRFQAAQPDELWCGDIERHEALSYRVEVKGLHPRTVAAARVKLRAA